MNIKLRIAGRNNLMRVEAGSEIQEVMIKESLESENETIAICFKSGDTSGIVELSTQEFEELHKQVNRSTHLVKGMQKFKSTEEEIPF